MYPDLTCTHTAEANRNRCGCGGLCDSGHPCPMADNVPLRSGLCSECQAEFEEDPLSWLEFGDYPQGLKNWADLQAEMAAAQDPTPPEAWDDIPF